MNLLRNSPNVGRPIERRREALPRFGQTGANAMWLAKSLRKCASFRFVAAQKVVLAVTKIHRDGDSTIH